jgi:hypothetical protein
MPWEPDLDPVGMVKFAAAAVLAFPDSTQALQPTSGPMTLVVREIAIVLVREAVRRAIPNHGRIQLGSFLPWHLLSKIGAASEPLSEFVGQGVWRVPDDVPPVLFARRALRKPKAERPTHFSLDGIVVVVPSG